MAGVETIPDRLAAIRQEMARIAQRSNRSAGDVELLCVSKTQDNTRILEALAAGQRLFGENRVQEAQDKWPALKQLYPDAKLHLIGPLQSNKARQAVDLFDVIETIDRPKIAEVLAHEIQKAGKTVELYIEINIGSEPQKAGILPQSADHFIKQCREDYGLNVRGLMCIPPQGQQAAPHFALLAQIAKRNGLAGLSMGMSADYPIAIQLGATIIRLGTAIFGERLKV
jgi:pyridoxal phosphate enzyme (YggS family)